MALAIEAGPLGGKSERTEATPHRERVEYPVRITVRKYACFAAMQVAPGLRILVVFEWQAPVQISPCGSAQPLHSCARDTDQLVELALIGMPDVAAEKNLVDN